MTASAPIDIHKELEDIWENHEGLNYMECYDLIVSMLFRVEAQTIERCEFYEDGTLHDIKRLYGPKSDKEEGL